MMFLERLNIEVEVESVFGNEIWAKETTVVILGMKHFLEPITLYFKYFSIWIMIFPVNADELYFSMFLHDRALKKIIIINKNWRQ